MRSHTLFNRNLWFLIFFVMILISCSEERNSRIPDESEIDIPQIEIKRYGEALFRIPMDDMKPGLIEIQDEFSFFLDGDLEDSLNVLRIAQFVSDPFLQEIAAKCEEVFPDIQPLEDSAALMFGYYQYHFPGESVPQIYTYISGLHFEQPVRIVDSVLIIGLDMFLGADSRFYPQVGMPEFLAERCTPAHILPYCAAELAARHNVQTTGEDLVSQMIFEGKRLYFESMLLPWKNKGTLLNYTSSQYNWCVQNEVELWAFLVDNEFVFSNELSIITKMMQDGPFTNSFGKESAPRLGYFLGMRIIESYMERNPEVSLAGLMRNPDAHAIFNQSGYKPR